MPNGCRRYRQLKETKEWYRMYSLYGMRQELPEGCPLEHTHVYSTFSISMRIGFQIQHKPGHKPRLISRPNISQATNQD